jgi:hypothetical protein
MKLTERARGELRPGEALVFDWHRVAICCAVAGEVSLRRTSEREVERSPRLRRLSDPDQPPVFAHERAYVHLAEQPLQIDCKRRLGMRFFTSDLPPDFGLRAVMGRVPDQDTRGRTP